jgi:hypothetical protein
MTTGTAFKAAKALDLDYQSSVLMECGCGAPLLCLQLSIYTKFTIGLDLSSVIKTVEHILALMKPVDKILASSILLISGII